MINIEVTSLQIAEMTGKKHFHVIRDIRDKLLILLDNKDGSKNGCIFSVTETTYKDQYDRDKVMYVLNKYAANAFVANYKMEHAIVVLEHVYHLEKELIRVEEENNILRDIIWENLNGMSVVNLRTALHITGIKNPILFMKYLRKTRRYKELKDEGIFLMQTYAPSKWTERFTKEGVRWLLNEKDTINRWVDSVKEKQSRKRLTTNLSSV